MQYQPLSARYNDNYQTSLQEMPWQVRTAYSALNRQTKDRFDQPINAWSEQLEKSPALLADFLRRMSDCMVLSGSPLYTKSNRNSSYLYDLADGRLRKQDYEVLMNLFGEEPAVGVKNNNIFDVPEQTITSKILTQPFDFSVVQKNRALAKEQILDDSGKGAKMAVQALVESMMAAGDGGLSELSNPKIQLPKTPDDWMSYMTGQEQMVSVMHDLLSSINTESNFQNLSMQAIYHKYRINSQFGFLDVANGKVRPRILHPNQVRWLAGKQVETLEDPAVIAVQVNDYMTGTELVNRFGTGYLNKGTGIKGVFAYLEKIYKNRKHWSEIGYDREANYWTDLGLTNDSWDYIRHGTERVYTPQQVNWMRNVFYPFEQMENMLLINILVQWNFVKVFREKRFKVEKIEEGRRTPATDRELERWQHERFTCKYDLDFTPVVTGENVTRANVKTWVKPDILSYVRIGHDSFVDVGWYKYQPDFYDRKSEDDTMHWPVKAQISHQPSMVKLMEEDAIRLNKLWQIFDSKLASKGTFDKAIIVDKTQGKQAVSYLYNGKMSGIIEYDSNRVPQNNVAASKHLDTVELGADDRELASVLTLIMQIQQRMEMRVGAGPQVQGVSQPYDGLQETKLNIASQELLNIRFHTEHNNFITQLLQGCADIAKFLYAKDDEVLVILPKNKQKILQLTSKLRLADFGIDVVSGQKLQEQMQVLNDLTAMLMQSGGADKAGALMESRLLDNPADRAAFLRKFEEDIRTASESAAQAAQKQKELDFELKKKELDDKVLMKQMEIDQERWQEQFRSDENRNKEDAKGIMNDINTVNNREDKLLDSQLRTDEARQQPSNQQSNQ